MQDSILKKFPDTDISVSLVWVEMLPTDNRVAAENMAASIRDPRVVHYFDPRGARLAGGAFAKGIIREGAGPAWDVYFFYDKDAEWQHAPPGPAEWFHQLGGGTRADPRRFAAGVIGDKLHEAMHRLTHTNCEHPRIGGRP